MSSDPRDFMDARTISIGERYPDAMVKVEVPNHGTYEATAAWVDHAIQDHLPGSSADMRRKVEQETGNDWHDVRDVTTLLIVLASFAMARAAGGF